jgi:thioredoxin-dependent peroxiredoxin
MGTGRDFDETLRALDAMQLTAKYKVATPVNWKPGEDTIILTSVPDADAKQKFPGGWNAPKPYLRVVLGNHLKTAIRYHFKGDYHWPLLGDSRGS